MKKWGIILNPKSGSGKGKKDWPLIKQLLLDKGFEFQLFTTEFARHAVQLSRQLVEEHFEDILVIGGDGTLNEVANGIIENHPDSNVTLGYIPVGTGNDWAKTMLIPAGDYKKSIDIIASNKSIKQDVGQVNCILDGEPVKRFFMNVAGFGFDGKIAHNLDQDRKKGKKTNKLTYLWSILNGMFGYKSQPAEIKFAEDKVNVNVTFSSVAICRFFGNGMLPAPEADPKDGLFELTIVDSLSPIGMLTKLKSFYNGTIAKYKEVSFHKTKEVILSAGKELLIQTDGEYAGHAPATFTILPNKLNVIINNEAFM